MVLIFVLFLFQLSAADSASGDPSTTKVQIAPSRLDIESLIENSDFKAISGLYEIAVNYYTLTKTRNPDCTKDADCMNYWNKVKQDLMKHNPEFTSSIREKTVAILAKRYSPQQIKWLLDTVKVPLYRDFINLYNGDNSPLPFSDAKLFLESKTKDLKPYVAIKTASPVK